jgi:hypothetical protein
MPYLLRAKNLESVIYCSQTFVWRLPRRVAAWYANLRDCTLPSERSVRLGPAGTSVWRVARPSSTRSLQAARALASRPRSDKHVLADETLGTAHGDFESGCVRGFPEMPVTCTRVRRHRHTCDPYRRSRQQCDKRSKGGQVRRVENP